MSDNGVESGHSSGSMRFLALGRFQIVCYQLTDGNKLPFDASAASVASASSQG